MENDLLDNTKMPFQIFMVTFPKPRQRTKVCFCGVVIIEMAAVGCIKLILT